MNRWFYILLPAISASLLWFAVARKQPEPPAIGIINTNTVLDNNREIKALLSLKKAWAQSGRRDKLHSGSTYFTGYDDTIFFEEERRLFYEGANLRRKALTDIKTQSSMSNLERHFMSLRNGHDRTWKYIAEKAALDLKDSYRKIMKKKKSDFMADEKFRLFNLEMKIRVLTRDPFVMPESRRVEIQDEIDRISSMIDQAEKNHIDSMQRDMKKSSERTEQQLTSMRAELDEDLKLAIHDALVSTEAILDKAIAEEESETQKIIDSAMLLRNIGSSLFSDRQTGSRSFDAEQYYVAALEKIRSEMLRRIRRKAQATAEKHNLYLVIDSPFPPLPGVIDITGEFLNIDNLRKKRQGAEQ